MSFEIDLDIVDDRRQTERISPPKPCWRISLILQSDRLTKCLFASKAGVSTFFIIFAICLSSIVWSVYYRLPSIGQSSSLINHQMRLHNELEALKGNWTEAELQKIEENISREQAKIFEGFPTFANWLKRKGEYANQLGLDMNYRLNEQEHTRLDDIISVAMKINLKVRTTVADKAYGRLLEFMRSLIDENRHLEIAGNELRSDGKGAKTMSLNIVVWLKDENAIGESLMSEAEFGESGDVPFVQE